MATTQGNNTHQMTNIYYNVKFGWKPKIKLQQIFPFDLSMNQIAISDDSNPHQWFCDTLPKTAARDLEFGINPQWGKILSAGENQPHRALCSKWKSKTVAN
jgi:hypothetical protein